MIAKIKSDEPGGEGVGSSFYRYAQTASLCHGGIMRFFC